MVPVTTVGLVMPASVGIPWQHLNKVFHFVCELRESTHPGVAHARHSRNRNPRPQRTTGPGPSYPQPSSNIIGSNSRPPAEVTPSRHDNLPHQGPQPREHHQRHPRRLLRERSGLSTAAETLHDGKRPDIIVRLPEGPVILETEFDPARIELDERLVRDMLGLDENAVATVARLRTLLATDPSIHGSKKPALP